MDLNAVTDVLRPRGRAELPPACAGDAVLGGGTWLFSEPQPHVRRLIDLADLGWPALRHEAEGLSIAATCTIAELNGFEAPVEWRSASLIHECCHAFLASFKIWNMATVGGNICLGLPAGPMISLCAALDGEGVLWGPDGGERRVSIVDVVRGPREVALAPGEVLRAVHLPAQALRRRAAFRRASLTPLGRSGVLVIGTGDADGTFALTVTASTRRPVRLAFPAVPEAAALAAGLAAAIPDELYYDDMHGRPEWRRHMTALLAQEIRDELAEARA
ncbi:CO/xanthine dehydrogenase FAD-binding subunit [Ancylobacter aquaticus]|uniref:CO/xanthine dehydrogenase FAD-binding subunit n=1 Tax=Ancylobacter aquaticus TaxID=100 RepID=A0A4R1HRE8_ANCAQ|nr:FAD binding domain-containing protein [Ancylobacter aquaticus]TCK23793.1 CO/xanthine dehydrogenase FAD-binding subunit [Ancylobacter aquaticus]